jgi:hypothetical protein
MLKIFELPQSMSQITLTDLKKAKRKAQLLHPDVSKLPNAYFLFYQKVYLRIEDEYKEYLVAANKQNTTLESAKKERENTHTMARRPDKRTDAQIREALGQMKPEEMNSNINRMFDQYQLAKQPDTRRADWLKQDTPIFGDVPEKGAIKTQEQMAEYLDGIKRNSQALMVRGRNTGPNADELRAMGGASNGAVGGTCFFDDEDVDDSGDGDMYIDSDPFSKLRYEDVRRVHGAETIMLHTAAPPGSSASAGTGGHNNRMMTDKEVQDARRLRDQKIAPMEKQRASQMMEERERAQRARLERAMENDRSKTRSYAEKNEEILRSILRITN